MLDVHQTHGFRRVGLVNERIGPGATLVCWLERFRELIFELARKALEQCSNGYLCAICRR